MSKHTPGRFIIQQDRRTGLVDIYDHGAHANGGEGLPPDLLAAASDMLALLQHIVANHGSVERDGTGSLEIIGILLSDFDAAKALIARAEGREP